MYDILFLINNYQILQVILFTLCVYFIFFALEIIKQISSYLTVVL